jgi:hypothetical protein
MLFLNAIHLIDKSFMSFDGDDFTIIKICPYLT